MPQVTRVGDPDTRNDKMTKGSAVVFAGDSGSSPPAQPAAPVEPDPPPSTKLVVPPVKFSAAEQAKIDKKTEDYVAAPEKYKQNSAITNDQVKGNYAGTPEQSSSVGESLIDATATGDIPTFLSKVLSEANAGQWSETGMGGKPSNPKILNIWKELGFGNNGAWGSDQTAWCMGFVNFVLKNTGYRFVQTARAHDIRDRASQYKVQSVPLDQGKPGDICLWSYSHVNFIYTASGSKYTFVGGNQSDKAKNANNPSGGSATKSWPSGFQVPGNGSLVSIWRPVKS